MLYKTVISAAPNKLHGTDFLRISCYNSFVRLHARTLITQCSTNTLISTQWSSDSFSTEWYAWNDRSDKNVLQIEVDGCRGNNFNAIDIDLANMYDFVTEISEMCEIVHLESNIFEGVNWHRIFMMSNIWHRIHIETCCHITWISVHWMTYSVVSVYISFISIYTAKWHEARFHFYA